MKVLVINGSPKGDRSNTMTITRTFLKGLIEHSNAEVEQVNINSLNIRPCLGCLKCWGKNHGQCVIKGDDMPMMIQKVTDADIIVQSFPLFFFGIPGQLKIFIDRMVSQLETYKGHLAEEGKMFHNFRNEKLMGKKFILISSCGYCSTELIYDALLKEYDYICGAGNYYALLCPQGDLLNVEVLKPKLEEHMLKYYAAGRELALTNTISEETINKAREPIFAQRAFKIWNNRYWESFETDK